MLLELEQVAQKFSYRPTLHKKTNLLPIEKLNPETNYNSRLDGKYPRFDLRGALSLTKSMDGLKIPVPQFALYNAMEAAPCTIRISYYYTGRFYSLQSYCNQGQKDHPGYPYGGYKEKIEKIRIHGFWATLKYIENGCPDTVLRSDFSGFIPEDTRNKIRELTARKLPALLVKEAQWNVSVEFKPDPLLVTYKDGIYYLVDKFNLTRQEKYIASEF